MSSNGTAPPCRWRIWLTALGPGAIVASLTIGTGELVFSSRAGALFGYRVLGMFLLVLVLKWALVFASARHWVFSEVHPLQRWAELPGPRGWLPMVLLLLAMPAFPIWVCFHSGTLGTLLAAVTHTRTWLGGQAPLAWGILILLSVLAMSATGGYARQERFQTAVVALMLVSVIAALVLLKPPWLVMFAGFLPAGHLTYPDWAARLPEFANRPVWVEAGTYAGVIGGSGYDYLAYVGWLRDKHGSATTRRVPPKTLSRLVMADATVSFLAVLVFSAVFVACGAIVLGPKQQVPSGSDLLTLQAQFVGVVGPWLEPLYFTGAFLALAGTLYGTIEVAPTLLRELATSLARPGKALDEACLRRWAVRWCGGGALTLLLVTLGWRLGTGTEDPFNLIALVTPANLFTGVLACGWISFLNVWGDCHGLPAPLRMRWPLALLNLVGGGVFCIVGLKAAWDQARWIGPAIIAGSVGLGLALAVVNNRQRG